MTLMLILNLYKASNKFLITHTWFKVDQLKMCLEPRNLLKKQVVFNQ